MKLRSVFGILVFAFVFQATAEVPEIDDIWDIKYNYRPIVIDAYASWCAPCRVYSPVVQRLAREYDGVVDFYCVDVDNPDAEDFVIRYEINSVPTTVFLWDPLGDASLKSRVERGMMGYDELKSYIEQTIEKQYRFKAETIPMSEFTWDRFSSDSFYVFSEYNANLLNYVGEWVGAENGCETRLWVSRDGSQFQILGGTLDSGRQQLVDTVYWIPLGAGWDEVLQALCLTEVLPLSPTSPWNIDRSDSATYRERTFKFYGKDLRMSVNEYNVHDRHVDSSPSKTYTVTYTKVI